MTGGRRIRRRRPRRRPATLASRFDRVTVLERDELPVGIAQRRGVPQGRHVHAILPGGLAAWLASPMGTDMFFVSASRPLIEGTVRRRCLDSRTWLFAPVAMCVGWGSRRPAG